ncbi:peptidase S8/S53 domain-containing protein [Ilyonectria destructans]|nr:peptidase S8/S53 domain-containing protein [Ilyonectria destructans]
MEPVTITINGNVVHHDAQKEGGAHFAPDASETNYLIIQSFAPLDKAQREHLRELGIELQQVISGDTYFCRYNPHDLTELRSLSFLHFVNPYHPDYVVSHTLKATDLDQGSYEVYITPHDDRESPDALKALGQKIAHRLNISESDIHPHTGYLRMFLKPEDFDEIAGLDEVRFISKVGKATGFNWTAREDIFTSQDDYGGVDEVVGVADMGIDVNHGAFLFDGSRGTGSRIQAALSPNANGTHIVGNVRDVSAHGTHVTGSVAGNWLSPGLHKPVLGTAPKAGLFCQVLFEENGEKADYPAGQSFQTLIEQAEYWKANVHTNSWGTRHENSGVITQDPYSRQTVDVDKSAWDHRNINILFAAGNFGHIGTQIGEQGAAKNCITVGACEPTHPLNYNPNRAPKYLYQLGEARGNPDRLAFFSSTGPTQNTLGSPGNNSRIKPDVVAPGVSIYSAKSSTAPAQGSGADTRPFNYFGTPPDNASPNDLFFFQQGTSMATPLAAGSCVVIRKALKTCLDPSAISSAMVKAVLINGTIDMTTSGVTQRTRGGLAPGPVALTPTPSPQQGFGRINLAKSLLCVPNTSGGFGGVFPLTLTDLPAAVLQRDGQRAKIIPIGGPPDTAGTTLGPMIPKLTVTMCYTDAPSIEGSGSLVNTLFLQVTSGTTTVYGNKPFGVNTPDTVNNVQKVVWENIPVVDATAVVTCVNVGLGLKAKPTDADQTKGGQDFALAWYLEWLDSSNNSTYRLAGDFVVAKMGSKFTGLMWQGTLLSMLLNNLEYYSCGKMDKCFTEIMAKLRL